MSRFRFRLSPLLDHRVDQEKERAVELALARAAEEEARCREEALARLEDTGRSLLRVQHAGGPAGHLLNMELLLDRVAEQADGAREAREEAAREVARTLDHYTEAAQERRSLERLRERMELVWRSDSSRREQKTMDELASARHQRGSGEMGEP